MTLTLPCKTISIVSQLATNASFVSRSLPSINTAVSHKTPLKSLTFCLTKSKLFTYAPSKLSKMIIILKWISSFGFLFKS